MDVDPTVKFIALAVALVAATSSALAQGVQVFGVGIEVREDCEVIVNHKDGKAEQLKLAFTMPGKCHVLPNSETNIPRVEFVGGEYVLLVEFSVTNADTCRANLAAIMINRDGRLRLSKPSQNTSACGSAERKDFEILRHHSRN